MRRSTRLGLAKRNNPNKGTIMKRFLLSAAVALIALVGLSANQCTSEQQQSQPSQPSQPPEQKPPQQ
jgi:cytochrome c-type biogenesis protein CcmH/NrfG